MLKANVLLVDDEVPFVETLTRRLSKRGIDMVTAFSGQEALSELEKNSNIEIVVLDIKMPGMDGLRVLEEIKREYPSVKVILLTGHSTIDTAIKGMRSGAFDYLLKPCDIDRLISRMEDAVGRKMQRKEAPKETSLEQR
jgi:DNA-binding NtrC family response regulator